MSFIQRVLDILLERSIDLKAHARAQMHQDGSTHMDLGTIQVVIHPEQYNATMQNPRNSAEVVPKFEPYHTNAKGCMDRAPTIHLWPKFSSADSQSPVTGFEVGPTEELHEASHTADFVETFIRNPPPDYVGKSMTDYRNEFSPYLRTLRDCSVVTTDNRMPIGDNPNSIGDPAWENLHDVCRHFFMGRDNPGGPLDYHHEPIQSSPSHLR